MKAVKMYDVDDEVMIKVQIGGIEIKRGELQYRIRDIKSKECLPYLYDDTDIIPIEKTVPSKTVKK